MKRKIIVAICLAIAICAATAAIFGTMQIVHAPVHWGGGRIDIKQVLESPKIQLCPWAWGGGRIDTKLVPA